MRSPSTGPSGPPGASSTRSATPTLVAEITLQPVRRYGVDAAILFSDIMVPVAAIGFGVDIRAGVGPVAERPFATAADLDRLRPLEPGEDTPWTAEAIRILVKELRIPLIGFAGGPFTLASYLVEGGPSRDHTRTKSLMYGAPDLWDQLVQRLADLSLASLQDQIEAGAQAVQVFDSWAGDALASRLPPVRPARRPPDLRWPRRARSAPHPLRGRHG